MLMYIGANGAKRGCKSFKYIYLISYVPKLVSKIPKTSKNYLNLPNLNHSGA